jgi:hypothetical protein
MFWAERTNKVTGITLLLVPFLSIVGFLAGSGIGELDPFAAEDVSELLRRIHESRGQFVAGMAPFVVTDVLVLPALAGLLYLAFRDRSRTLALVGAFAILTSVPAFVVHEVGAATLPYLAADYFRADVSGLTLANLAVLQSARTIGVAQALAALFGQTAMGFGFLAFGSLIAWAPAGERNPPRWLGWLGVVGGIASLLTWAFLLNHTAGGVFTLVGELAVLILVAGLGVWLLRQPTAGLGA